MRLVLNLPLPSYQGEQALRCGPLRAQTRDAIDSFDLFLACVLDHDMMPQLKDLRQTGPIAVAHEGCTRRDMALLNAPMPNGHGARGVLPGAEGRERKDQLHIGPQLRLGVLADHDRIPALVDHRLCDVALGQECLHCDHPTFQDQLLSDGLDGRELIGFVVHGVWGECHADLVRQRRSQVGPRRALFFGTAQRFPIEGCRGLRGLRGGG
jgi:hypothetical protein